MTYPGLKDVLLSALKFGIILKPAPGHAGKMVKPPISPICIPQTDEPNISHSVRLRVRGPEPLLSLTTS
jgi:hypothetical protein